MKRHSLLLALALFLSLLCAHVATADTPPAPLTAGAKAEYRLDYLGDGSPINVALDVPNPSGISVLIFTPAQVEELHRGGKPTPVGRGTPNRNHTLYWSGGFKIRGVYRVFVENNSQGPVLYRLDITGSAVNGAAQVLPVNLPPLSGVSTQGGRKTLTVTLPPGAATANGQSSTTVRLTMPVEPQDCTHANQVPAIVDRSIKLCPNEVYFALNISGNHIGVFSDDQHTAVVTSAGRQFAITIQGAGNWVEGVTIQARAESTDQGAWLCLYDDCAFPTVPPITLHGGTRYGGGILLRGSNSIIHGVTVKGGTIGIASVGGRSNYILENQLSDLNGWGSFNIGSVGSYYVGNVMNRDNHACTTPDGRKFLHGCETSGWVCLGCSANVVARNHCELSANCFYMSGERGLASNDNRFVANYCAGATDNCFELTFSRGNILRDNVSTADQNSDKSCKYPFWIGGSTVYHQGNSWECAVDEQEALRQAKESTTVPTDMIPLSAMAGSAKPPTRNPSSATSKRLLGKGAVAVGVLQDK